MSKHVKTTCEHAALTGNLADLKKARQYNKPWDNTLQVAATAGNLHIIKWALQNGCPWKSSVVKCAALAGKIEVLRWLNSNDHPLGVCAFTEAVENEKLKNILHQNGWPWKFKKALHEKGLHEIITWAQHNGCFMDEWTFKGVALYGHFEILQWLDKRQCPRDSATCEAAAQGGHLHILKWVVQHGCELSKQTMVEAIRARRMDMIEWINWICHHKNNLNGYVTNLYFSDYDNHNYLRQSIYSGCFEVFKYFFHKVILSRTHDIFVALGCGHMQMARYCIENLNENESREFCRQMSNHDMTTICNDVSALSCFKDCEWGRKYFKYSSKTEAWLRTVNTIERVLETIPIDICNLIKLYA